jgi:beta-glucosidase
MPEFMKFPKHFQWGTATSAYQIEGAVSEDGRSESIWDTFVHQPGAVVNGDTGDCACDHYHLWKKDIALMKDLGFKTYRFSLAWPRILPGGRGKVNPAGLDFYNRLIDELLGADITPLVTLYHWDLPSALTGTWLDRSTVDAFTEYTNVSARAFGDRVKNWVTINEPYCASHLSYTLGVHAPGMKDKSQALLAAHHLLLAHGLAVPEIRANCAKAQVGIALNLGPFYPETQTPANIDAVRHEDGALNRWFLDPLYGRQYPADIIADFVRTGVLKSEATDYIKEKDYEHIAAKTDFLAINYYTRAIIRASDDHQMDPSSFTRVTPPIENHTEMGWEIFPYGLYEIVTRVHHEYAPEKIIIAENGASYSDGPDSSGRVHDEKRIAYLNTHIGAIGKAIKEGVPVTGYYVWSFMDNFEWSFGYAQRFGLVYVDFSTQERYPKDSAFWYGQIIKQNGIDLANSLLS